MATERLKKNKVVNLRMYMVWCVALRWGGGVCIKQIIIIGDYFSIEKYLLSNLTKNKILTCSPLFGVEDADA